MYRIIPLILIILFFSSCSSPKSNDSTKNNTAYLVDSAISGVQYTCNDISGITNTSGEFIYNNSCEVIFKIGNIFIGNIHAEDINIDKNVLPADLIGVKRDNIKDEKLVKLIQFLQTIDNDDNPDNNIEISEKTRQIFQNSFLDFTTSKNKEYEITKALNLIHKKLVSKNKALKHYKKTLETKFKIHIKNDLIIKQKVFKIKHTNFISQEENPISTPIELLSEYKTDEEIEVIANIKDAKEDVEDKQEVKEQRKSEVIEEAHFEEKIKTNNEVIETYNKEEINNTPKEITIIESLPTKDLQELPIIVHEDNKQNHINETIEDKTNETKEEESSDEVIKPSIYDVLVELESKNTEEENLDNGFSYENQRDVKINISTKELTHNKQVLVYEKMNIINTPVGNLEKLENIIVSTTFNENGALNLTYTLGNHIKSVWVVVPYYNLNIEVPINNNYIDLKINN